MPRLPAEARRKAWDGLSLRASEGTSSIHTFILDFYPPELELRDLLFEAIWCVVICHGSPGTLIHPERKRVPYQGVRNPQCE